MIELGCYGYGTHYRIQHSGLWGPRTNVGSDKFAAGIFDRIAFRECITTDIYHSSMCNSTMQSDRDFRGDVDQTLHFLRPLIVQYSFIPLNRVVYFYIKNNCVS